MVDRNDVFSTVFPYLVGALIGVAIALLIAPQSGQDTRQMIRSRGLEIKDKTVDTIEGTRDRAGKAIGDLSQQTKESISTMAKRGQEKVEQGVDMGKRALSKS